ncbi:MAG: hypothetical protein AAFR59_08440, partial [Bacteroidota bacterium]
NTYKKMTLIQFPHYLKWLALCLWLVPFCVMAQPGATSDPGPIPIKQRFQADQLYEEGESLYIKNQMDGALLKFNDAIRLNPKHVQAHEMRGEIYYMRKNWNKAFENFKLAAAYDPFNAKLQNDLGATSGELGLYRAAISYFQEALSLDSAYADAKTNLDRAQRLLAKQGGVGGFNKDRPTRSNGQGSVPGRNKFVYSANRAKTQGSQKPAIEDLVLDKTTFITSDPQIGIRNIFLDRERGYTVVTFEILNPSGDKFSFKLDRPKGEQAWMIADYEMKKFYPLRSYVSPPRFTGGKKETTNKKRIIITAYFDLIPDNLRQFHILEGKRPFEGGWNFYNLQLKPEASR